MIPPITKRLLVFVGAVIFIVQLSITLHAATSDVTPYRIMFLGDTSFGESYQEQYEARGEGNILKEKGYDYSLAKFKPLLMQANLVIANLETPVTNLPTSPFAESKTYVHWTDMAMAPKYLKKYNINVVSLANNHTGDYGVKGLEQTLDVLSENKIKVFGAGLNEKEAAKPYRTEIKIGDRCFKMAVLGAFEYVKKYDCQYDHYARNDHPGTCLLSAKKISEQIDQLKKENPETYVVVFPHWGKNYKWKTKKQTEMCHKLIDAGADLIIGHGAHMMQEIEQYKGKWCIYSVGNFVFNTQGRYQKLNVDPFAFVAQLSLSLGENGLSKSIRLYPTFTDNRITNFQSRPVTANEFKKVHHLLVAKSPEPRLFRQEVKSGKDDLGYFVEFAVP